MSVYLGTELLSGIATNTISNGHTLFDFKWTDHTISSMEWTRADTFSWQDGSVYVAAHEHLEADFRAGEDMSETIGSYTIDFVLAPDGHKIVLPNMETTVSNIYDETGVAWYYVLDRVNDRFKLPRTKYGFTGYRDSVGKYVSAGLPNITGNLNTAYGTAGGTFVGASGAFSGVTTAKRFNRTADSNNGYSSIDFKASDSNAIYGNSTTVQPPATQMYLYFYVGEFNQSATEQTAGLNASLFNEKVDLDGSWGFPSDNYDELTLGASGTTYTAPADGYFTIEKALGTNASVLIKNSTNGLGGRTLTTQADTRACCLFLPVRKGDVITVTYANAGATGCFRFVYAQKTN